MTHAILIAPKAYQAAANALGEALGHGPDTYSVPLYAADATEPTHYAGCAPVSDLFVSQVAGAMSGVWMPAWAARRRRQVAGAMSGVLPDALSEYSVEQVQGLISQLIIDFADDVEGSQHFQQVLEAHGLTQQPAELPD